MASAATVPVTLAHEAPFQIGGLSIEPELRRITRADGVATQLEPLMMKVLVTLARAGGHVVSRDALVESCWGGRIVGDDSIARVIFHLRKVAADFAQGAFSIETTAKVGFRLVGEVSSAVATASRPTSISRRGMAMGLAALAVSAGGAAVWYDRRNRVDVTSGAPQRLAVLRFANVSEDVGQQYFADGMTEELRDRLARLASVNVVARTSSNAVQKQGLDAQAIGRELGVSYLIEGSVRRSGQLVRVSATLIDTQTGFPRWTQSYDRKLDDVFAIQGEIAQAVTTAVLGKLGGGDAEALIRSATVSPEAFEAYAKGRALRDMNGDEVTFRAALAAFDRAIALDPNYAPAWGQRARVLGVIASQYSSAEQLPARYEEGLRSARRAVALAPKLAEAHVALAFLLASARLDVAGAETAYERAYALGPGNADVLIPYAGFAVRVGRDKAALVAANRAVALDPLNPRSHYALGYVLSALRRVDAAVAAYRKALALSPAMSTAYGSIAFTVLPSGRFKEARQALAREPSELMRLTGLAIIEDKEGNKVAAQSALARLVASNGDAAAYQRAQILAQWGDRDGALAMLELARRVGDAGLLSLRVDPALDPLRGDPRFAALLARIGFSG